VKQDSGRSFPKLLEADEEVGEEASEGRRRRRRRRRRSWEADEAKLEPCDIGQILERIQNLIVHEGVRPSLVGGSHHLAIPLLVRLVQVIKMTIIVRQHLYNQADRKTTQGWRIRQESDEELEYARPAQRGDESGSVHPLEP